MSQENLPIELKNNQLAVNKRNTKRTIDGIKRIGKILLSTGIGITGVTISSVTGPIIATAGLVIGVAGFSNALMDTFYKKISKNSMFVQSRMFNGEIKISQSLKDFKSFRKMKEFTENYEKSAMMGMELLTELQAIKQKFEDSGKRTELARNGENNVYSQIYSTKTHGKNIEILEALEILGYLQIERKQPKEQSSLFFEKLGFTALKKDAMLEFFKEYRKSKIDKVQMYDIALKVTDKTLDFEQMHTTYKEMRKNKDPKTRAMTKILAIFKGLSAQNIDIVKNELGEIVIDYNSQGSFYKRKIREERNPCAEY